MARWIALGLTLICVGSCSFTSPDVFRGAVAPIGALVLSLVTLFLFIQERVASVARPSEAAILDPETQLLIRNRAKAKAPSNTGTSEPSPRADA